MKLIMLDIVCMASFACTVAGGPQTLVKRGNYPNSAMKSMQCPITGEQEPTCVMADLDSWPKKDFSCEQPIHLNVMQKIADAIAQETSPPQPEAAPPSGLRDACRGKPVFKNMHGNVVTFYMMDLQCSCPQGQEPNCSNAVAQNPAACNFAK
ncbi:hypothetical protein VP01_970g5 [Puccinia sorghi]|uniref:Uncharacterized protein n=1 Tax=Puccinia sorghi TaxID=27349 RepID=A0A0L6U6H4_9BASI|nr:hypothetical protein VP01_970g5 [Puccinia sorghi]